MLSRVEARRYYDRFGSAQDRQAFYEDAALDKLVRHADFEHARAVVEFGCGTGRFAERLLREVVPVGATYGGFDQSSTMVELAAERLAGFGERARIVRSDGSMHLGEPADSCDRFVCTYVIEILSESDQRALLTEAYRLLAPGGRICLTTITPGCSVFSQAVMGMWNAVHRARPGWVGGCRPMTIQERLGETDWEIAHREVLSRWGIASEIVVARSRKGA